MTDTIFFCTRVTSHLDSAALQHHTPKYMDDKYHTYDEPGTRWLIN